MHEVGDAFDGGGRVIPRPVVDGGAEEDGITLREGNLDLVGLKEVLERSKDWIMDNVFQSRQ